MTTARVVVGGQPSTAPTATTSAHIGSTAMTNIASSVPDEACSTVGGARRNGQLASMSLGMRNAVRRHTATKNIITSGAANNDAIGACAKRPTRSRVARRLIAAIARPAPAYETTMRT